LPVHEALAFRAPDRGVCAIDITDAKTDTIVVPELEFRHVAMQMLLLAMLIDAGQQPVRPQAPMPVYEPSFEGKDSNLLLDLISVSEAELNRTTLFNRGGPSPASPTGHPHHCG
jgi:hypothetical protein